LKLYHAALSPFSARCRIQIYAKDLDVELAAPPGGAGSEAYQRINPTGKVPALEIDGAILPESAAILEFLEDRFPQPSLRPADDLARGRMRVLMQLADQYVVPPLVALFAQANPETRDPELVAARLAELLPRLDLLERFLSREGPYAAGPALSLADCSLFPLFFFATRLLPLLGEQDPTAARPRLRAWWQAAGKHPAVARVDAELTSALAEALRALGGGP
jgi:glutathione S-transferase